MAPRRANRHHEAFADTTRTDKGHLMTRQTGTRAGLVLIAAMALAGCQGGLAGFLQSDTTPEAPATTTELVERDVEAPEIFHQTEPGLWDGRPSLGGVWVAHPDVTDPERVIIRNLDTGKFVIGALFRREREMPGPRFQVSSDAAAALGMLAGKPARLDVTALRRQEAPAEATDTTEATADTTAPPAPGAVEQAPLDDPIAAAAAALDAAENGTATAPAAAAAALTKPYIQIGIFSVEANAQNTVAALENAGLNASIKPGSSAGKAFWRVIVGPAATAAARADALAKVKSLGFTDAYFVSS